MLSDISAGAVSVFDVIDVELIAVVDAGISAVGAGEDCESCESL